MRTLRILQGLEGTRWQGMPVFSYYCPCLHIVCTVSAMCIIIIIVITALRFSFSRCAWVKYTTFWQVFHRLESFFVVIVLLHLLMFLAACTFFFHEPTFVCIRSWMVMICPGRCTVFSVIVFSQLRQLRDVFSCVR